MTTDVPKNISYTKVDLGGIITGDGGAQITERGVFLSLNPNPTISDIKVVAGKGIGTFTINTQNLKDNTKYYVKAYAINQKGTSYGNEQNFSTIQFKLPTFTTSESNSVGSTSFFISSDISDDGGTEIVERGFCYSINPNPSINDFKTKSNLGLGIFFNQIENLKEGTKYYVRPYAFNSLGVGYGNTIIVNTLAQSAIFPLLKEGVLAYYNLDGNLNDLSGNGNNLLIDGEVIVNTSALDRFGNSKSCFGFNQFGMGYPSQKLNNSNDFFAVSYWSKTSVSSGSNLSNLKLIGLNILSTNEELNFYLAKNYNYYVGNSFSNQSLELSANNTYDSNWHFFFINFDFKNGIITYYMDGIKRNEMLIRLKPLGLFNFGIGNWYESKLLPNGNADTKYNRRGWSGYIDDVGLWNRNLSLDEIKHLYNKSFTIK